MHAFYVTCVSHLGMKELVLRKLSNYCSKLQGEKPDGELLEPHAEKRTQHDHLPLLPMF